MKLIRFDDMSSVGKEAHRRMLLEAERRFCDNKTEIVNNSEHLMNERSSGATMLDPRLMVKLPGMTKEIRDKTFATLKSLYVEFAMNAEKHNAPPSKTPPKKVVQKKAPTELGEDDCGWDDLLDDDGDDDDDDDGDEVDVKAQIEREVKRDMEEEIRLEAQFSKVHRKYMKIIRNTNWLDLYPDLLDKKDKEENADPGEVPMFDLMHVDLGILFKKLIADDPDRKKYGYLPYMATHSYFSCGSLQSSSFSERVNSAASMVLSIRNSCMSDELINMLTQLRIGRSYMDFCREHYLEQINKLRDEDKRIQRAVVREEVNEEVNENDTNKHEFEQLLFENVIEE
jgi:hypothetical protein